jgi:hypothetical protein
MEDKVETHESQLANLDQATLTPLVRDALGSKTVEVLNWKCEQIHGGMAVGTSIYRFSGQGRDRGQSIPWSLILKILQPEGGSADGSAWNYFKREAEAYQSGFLDNLGGGLAAPRCFGFDKHADGTCWMWLEEIMEQIGADWPLEHYGVVARHLGHFNGLYLAGKPLPNWPWLSSDWIRQYVELSAPAMEQLRDMQASPWGRRFLPEVDSHKYFQIWEQRARYFDILDRLPQTICHLDAFRRNLFARKTANGDDQTGLIDWAFVGRAPIGVELSQLVLMSVALGGIPFDRLPELEQIVFDGYLGGLREAGWQGDPRLVRLGYTASSVRYLFPEIGRWLELILDETLHAAFEKMACISMTQSCYNMSTMRLLHFDYLEEARRLMPIMN